MQTVQGTLLCLSLTEASPEDPKTVRDLKTISYDEQKELLVLRKEKTNFVSFMGGDEQRITPFKALKSLLVLVALCDGRSCVSQKIHSIEILTPRTLEWLSGDKVCKEGIKLKQGHSDGP